MMSGSYNNSRREQFRQAQAEADARRKEAQLKEQIRQMMANAVRLGVDHAA